jgi:hypothetical protein
MIPAKIRKSELKLEAGGWKFYQKDKKLDLII